MPVFLAKMGNYPAIIAKRVISMAEDFRSKRGRGNRWAREASDAYLSAGTLASDISDRLTCAKMRLNDPRFAPCHESRKTISASTESYLTMGIHMDETGMAWIMDSENRFIRHDGAAGHYNG